MKFIATLVFLAVCCFVRAGAQSYSGTTGIIPDNGATPGIFTANVTGLSPTALTAAHGLKKICLNITHNYVSDLEVTIKAPDGTEVLLFTNIGGNGHNFTNTCFQQSSNNPIASGTAPFSGTYKPQANLGYINNGQNGNGTWTLRVYDGYPQDQGTLLNWTITFDTAAPVAAPFSQSNLPIIVINTAGQSIVDDPKITANMGVIFNGLGNVNHLTDPFNNYNGKIGIEIRGSSSQQFPKKNYSVETDNAAGNDTDVALLGMPKQSDWVLYASYTDKSLINNVLAYKLYRDFGGYASRTVYTELVINGQYKGVYVLEEKIKRDSARVDISKLTTADTVGANVTGGYIIKIDKTTGSGGAGWYSAILPPVHPSNQKIFYQYEYPKDVDILPKQKAYIKSYVDSFEAALNAGPLYDTVQGWRHFADEKSFLRYFILNELSRDVDGYRISTYLYKQKITKGGKLVVGPPWDYDIAFHNANYCNGDKDTGWAYQYGLYTCSTDGNQVPFWWGRLMTDTTFRNNLKCMYTSLRANALDTAHLYHYIDSTALFLDSAQRRNFAAWPILGQYVWPNPTPIPTTYAGEVLELKQYLARRLSWLDAHIPGICRPPVAPNAIANIAPADGWQVFPNPFTNELRLAVNAGAGGPATVRLLTMDGRAIATRAVSIHAGRNDLSVFEQGNVLPPGIYLLQVADGAGVKSFRVVRQ